MRARSHHPTSSSLSPTTAHSTMREKKRSASMSQTLKGTPDIKNVMSLSWINKHKEKPLSEST